MVQPAQHTMSVAPTPSSEAPVLEGLPLPRRRYATVATMTALVLVVLDGAIVNVALPTIAADLAASPALSIWVVTAYQMALVMALLPCAALGESLGLKRVFVGGIVVFTAASLLCALSPSLPWLIAARFLQGLGAAAVMALATALMRFSYPHRMLGVMIGWNAMVIALSAAAGPTIGAAILSVSSWPWLFAVNLPVGAIVLVAALALPKPAASGSRLDLLSVALNATAFATLVLGVDLISNDRVLGFGLLAVAAVSLTALVRREMPRAAPLFPLDLLRVRPFRISVIASICCFAGQMASYVALPFYLQHNLGLSPVMAGLYMTPWPLAVAFAGPLSGRMADRIHNGLLCAAGGIALATGVALAAAWPVHDNLLPLVFFLILSGLGFGFFQTPNNRNMLLSAPRQRSGAAGGMQGTARLLGQTMGGVIMTLLFSLTPADMAPRIGLAVAAVLALVSGLVSLTRVSATAQDG